MHIPKISVLLSSVKTGIISVKTRVEMPKRFNGLLKGASMLNNPVIFYGEKIHDFNELSNKISKRGSNVNVDVLHIFEKAILTNNASASLNYSSELELDMLLPNRLSTGPKQRKLKDFLISGDPTLSLAILREFGAIRRTYHSPMKLFRESGRINNAIDVHDLTEHHFGELIKKALELGVVTKINYGTIKGTDDLARAICINNLSEDGQTFLLFKKALENTIIDAGRNPHILYTLDLGYLIASQAKVSLGTSSLNDTMIDDIIDEKDLNVVYGFLIKFRVLDLKYRS